MIFSYFFRPKLGKTHIKKSVFLVVGPLRGGRGVTPPTTKQKKHFFSINGENSPGSCIMKYYFMKYDIQSKFSPKCTPNFVCVYFYWFENNIRQKKIRLFQLKNFRIFFCQNPFQAIIRLKKKEKKKKKWHGPLNHQGERG